MTNSYGFECSDCDEKGWLAFSFIGGQRISLKYTQDEPTVSIGIATLDNEVG